MTHYPAGFRTALLAVLAAVCASGLALAPTTLAVRVDWDLPWRLAGGERLWAAALHCAFGFAAAAFAGALWSLHMRSGWRRRRQRPSGALLAATLVLLAATAVAVYYLGDDRLATIGALLHLGAGVAATAVFLWHWRRGRRRRLRGGGAP